MRSLRLGIVFCGPAVLALVGCRAEDKRYDVSGTVTYAGKPIPKGLIFFDPDASKGMAGTQGFANIRDGKFDTAKHGKGIRGGPYVVRVSGFDGKEASEAPFGQPLFPEYQEKRDLPAANSTLDIDVPRKHQSR
jgi:hypothetical protein